MQMEVNSYKNVSALKLGDIIGPPADFLDWITTTSANESKPFTVWGLSNETPAFYYSPEDLKRIVSIALALRHYYAPLLIVLGCLGNVLTISTVLMTKLNKLPTMHFFVGIATIDLCFLLSLLLWWIGSFSSKITTLPGWCQLVTFLSHLSSFTSVWLHCALAVERYLSIARDKCVNICFLWCAGNRGCHVPEPSCVITCNCSTLRVKSCIVGIFIIGVVVYVNMCLTVDYIFYGTVAVCVPMRAFYPVLQVLSKLDIIINVFIPYVTILVLSLRTMWVFVRNYRNKDRIITRSSLGKPHRFLRKKVEIHLTVSSFVLCITFLCLNSPCQVLRVIYLVQDTTVALRYITLQEYLIQQIFQAAYYTKFAINLPVMLIFHKGFRKALKLLLWRVQLKIKGICHRGRTPVPLHTLQFTVQFSSTLMKLHETSLL